MAAPVIAKTLAEELIKSVRQMGKHAEYAIGGYLVGATATGLAITYNNGVNDLNRFRNNQLNLTEEELRTEKVMMPKTEREAIRYGCYRDNQSKFRESAVWPYTILSYSIPYFIEKTH